MDGARIFNAAEKLQNRVLTLCQPVDAVQFCLTKGLAAPFGAVLTGSAAFIEKARWLKQRLGGGFRQAGYMAAAGTMALQTMQQQIAEDNRKADFLAAELQKIHPALVVWDGIMTNIISLDLSDFSITGEEFLQGLLQKGIKIKPLGGKKYRIVCHKDISWEDLSYVKTTIKHLLLCLDTAQI